MSTDDELESEALARLLGFLTEDADTTTELERDRAGGDLETA